MSLVLLTGTALRAQSASASGEYLLKAAFLYNFAKFVEWPEEGGGEQDGRLLICVTGDDPFGSALETLDRKTVQSRVIALHRLSPADSLRNCHILFISPSEMGRVGSILTAIKGAPILTVCDTEGCAEKGVMVGLRRVFDSIRIDINQEAVRRSQLRVSSQLLRLATIVKSF